MPLITVEGFREDAFASLADDAPLPDGAVLVSLARFQAERDALIGRNAPSACGSDPMNRRNAWARMCTGFPWWRWNSQNSATAAPFPGRGCCAPGSDFTGEIRAVGDFLYDQIAYPAARGLQRMGGRRRVSRSRIFDRALSEISNVYQPSADGRKTIRELRAADWRLESIETGIAHGEPERSMNGENFMQIAISSAASGRFRPLDYRRNFQGTFVMRKALIPMLASLAAVRRGDRGAGRHQCAGTDKPAQAGDGGAGRAWRDDGAKHARRRPERTLTCAPCVCPAPRR